MATIQIGAVSVEAVGPLGAPAVLLCHGFGASGDDLVPLARALDPRGKNRWFFPAAPRELPWGGRAWWEIDMVRIQMLQRRGEKRAFAEETPDGLAAARAAIEAVIDELVAKHEVRRDKLVIGGFSQGSMLTTEVALHATSPFAGLVVLSGTLLSEARWREAAKASGPGIHAFVTHGRRDPVLPFEGAEALRDLLTGAGATVDWLAHDGAHEIPPPALRRLDAFLQRRL